MNTAVMTGMEQFNILLSMTMGFISAGFILMWLVAFVTKKITSHDDKTCGSNLAVIIASIIANLFVAITILYGLFFAVTKL